MEQELKKDIKFVKGVGEKRAGLFKKLGVTSVGTLVSLFPRSYESWDSFVDLCDAVPEEINCVKARIVKPPHEVRIRKGMTLYKCIATDGAADLHITFFNNPYVMKTLTEGEEYLFLGKVTGGFIRKEMAGPAFQKFSSARGIRPVYPQTAGLNSRTISRAVCSALELLQGADIETLTPKIMNEYGLIGRYEALQKIHNPKTMRDVELARKRLIFEEFLLLQLGMMRLKNGEKKRSAHIIGHDYTKEFFAALPFEPTSAQRRAAADCAADMSSGKPMNRMIEGDVGSGKTAVAAAVCWSVIKNGFQAALMAPTEILARQHFDTFTNFFEGSGIKTELLTGSVAASEKKKIYQRVKNGETDMLIGTHALISDGVEFNNAGLVVTDEQHRFGVNQRAGLVSKGGAPHVLVMSATPIPRTLSLIIYGDLDLSVLDEMPKGRQKTETYAVGSAMCTRVWAYVKKHLDAGYQGYIVCPLVEDGDEKTLVSAVTQANDLAEYEFGDYSVGLIHGKMKPKEKDAVMKDFKDGKIQLLVSTTVVEVGVDVPNAVIMVIQNAERFGLSQLHQLRGRVGRGSEKSTCILISDAKGAGARARLETMCRMSDGFEIANEDLKLRGPGDFFGERQHGLPKLAIADMAKDAGVLKTTNLLAKAILNSDPAMSSPRLANLKEAADGLFEAGRQN
ncbi:MAG: ATP-dependent DNA helicase RecG [Acutalibacteraceae bacterium]